MKPIPATQIAVDASSQRHVLPKNLRKAVKQLSDAELELLHSPALEEMGRRGRSPPSDQTRKRSSPTDTSSRKRPVEAGGFCWTGGKIKAVGGDFNAGIKPPLIARQFGISQLDVRKVLAMDAARR